LCHEFLEMRRNPPRFRELTVFVRLEVAFVTTSITPELAQASACAALCANAHPIGSKRMLEPALEVVCSRAQSLHFFKMYLNLRTLCT